MKVGDRVRVVQVEDPEYFMGEIGTVTEIRDGVPFPVYVDFSDFAESVPFTYDEVQVVE